MNETEGQMIAGILVRRVDRILATLTGLTPLQIETPPQAPEANSLLVLAVHTMENAKENVLEVIGGQQVERDRDNEFRATGRTADDIQAEWNDLRHRIITCLDTVTPAMLDKEYEHPRRGRVTGRKVLLSATVHAAEHVGHAELTRDLLLAQR